MINYDNESGMFSKAGKLCIEMYTILQDRNYILTGKRKKHISLDIKSLTTRAEDENKLPKMFSNKKL